VLPAPGASLLSLAGAELTIVDAQQSASPVIELVDRNTVRGITIKGSLNSWWNGGLTFRDFADDPAPTIQSSLGELLQNLGRKIVVPDFDIDLLGHSYFAQAEALLHDMYDLIRHGAPPAMRQRISPTVDEGSVFWKLRR
jgi:hypothetical protein